MLKKYNLLKYFSCNREELERSCESHECSLVKSVGTLCLSKSYVISVCLFSVRVCLVMGRTLRYECLNWRRRWRPWRRSIKICMSSPLNSWPNPTRRAFRSPPSEQSDQYENNGREECIKWTEKYQLFFPALVLCLKGRVFFLFINTSISTQAQGPEVYL